MARPTRIVLTVASGAEGEIQDGILEAFETRLGPRAQQTAQRLAPVLSGDLRDSIQFEALLEGNVAVLRIGVDEGIRGVDYGRYVEDGTSRAAAQPFLRPAIYQLRGAL